MIRSMEAAPEWAMRRQRISQYAQQAVGGDWRDRGFFAIQMRQHGHTDLPKLVPFASTSTARRWVAIRIVVLVPIIMGFAERR